MSEQTRTQRKWGTIEFDTSVGNEDLASWLIMQCGASGCEVMSLEDDGGKRSRIRATFDKAGLTDDEMAKIRSSFEEYGLGECLQTLRISEVEEEDWLSRWKEGFEPFALGQNLMICPSWYKDKLPDSAKNRVCLFIEPGMAFGTGLHATTRYCLTVLEQYSTGQSVLDVGTGSGILAIAAALLNEKARIIAIDNDPVAVENAQHNIELNGVAQRISLVQGEIDNTKLERFDTILSNLTCEDIIALLPKYVQILNPGGCIICAGILMEKLDKLVPELERNRLRIIDDKLDGHWVGLTLGHS